MTPQPVQSPSVWPRVLAVLGALAFIGASVVLSNSPPASAAGLETFAGCAELQEHMASAVVDVTTSTVADLSGGDTPTAGEATGAPADGRGGDSGGTNTQVVGIDELDIVDVLVDGRILAARENRIVLIDATGTRTLATLDVAGPTQITFDDERATFWAVGGDWDSTTLWRVALDGDAFVNATSWELAGRLVDLRRDGGRVHLVAVDDDLGVRPLEDTGVAPPESVGAEDATLPFAGTSPVACDQVLHSPLPGGPATTLVASFDATGELAPVAATEIVGAGDNVLVTQDALYVSTPTFDGNRQVTGIHRFALDGLVLTGSGSVEGRLLNQFSLDEHAGHLRAAVTVGDGGFVGVPMPVEGDGGAATAGSVAGVDDSTATRTEAAPSDTEPPVTEPTTTATTEPTTTTELTTTTTGPTTTTAPTTTTSTEPPTTTEPPITVVPPTVPEGDALNEIVTFDLDGALDVVGRSARFGHPGEALQGIRFNGDVAYAVTFLQTDPLYVIDMSKPSAPVVLGQIEIPGFSAYLHPLSSTQVVGFGPGGEGQIVARLFDVSDRSAPRLLDTANIGEDSPIVWDHHALRTDGDNLVVAANRYVADPPERCESITGGEAELNALYLQMDELYRQMEAGNTSDTIPPEVLELQTRIDALAPCVYPSSFPRARIVILAPDGGSLQVRTIETDASDAQRVLPLDDGYLVVGLELTRVDAGGATVTIVD